MPLPGHQKILQSAAQVLFLLPRSLTEAAPVGQACGHRGRRAGVAQGPLLTSPGADLPSAAGSPPGTHPHHGSG